MIVNKPAHIRNLVLHLLLIGFVFFYSYPILWIISASLKTRQEFFQSGLNIIPQQFMWENYSLALQTAKFNVYLGNTLIVAVATASSVVLLTSMAGYALARYNFLGSKIIIAVIVITMFLPRGYTIIPIFDIVKRLSLLNTLWSVILVTVATSIVFNTFLFMGYFRSFPKELEDAATIDGASFPMIYWHIALPLAKPMVVAIALFEFIETWNSFFVPLVFTFGRPDLRTVSVGIYAFVGQHSTEWTLMAAASTLSLLPSLILFVLFRKAFFEGMASAMPK